MLIRAATAADAHGIMAVHVAAIRRICSAAYSPDEIDAWASAATPERYLGAIADNVFLVVSRQEEIVGFSELDVGTAELRAIFVHPAHVGQGIGRLLLRTTESRAMMRGIGRLHLHSALNAIGFYQAHGFVLDAMGTFRLRSGVSLACADMHKELTVESSSTSR